MDLPNKRQKTQTITQDWLTHHQQQCNQKPWKPKATSFHLVELRALDSNTAMEEEKTPSRQH